MVSPFDHPEITELFNTLLDKLLEESGRGALLIATTHVDDHLTKLIKEVLPKDISKKHTNTLFKYPGALSSFSAKIELAYAFRLINQNLYDCLNALRKIRNDAAHSPSILNLYELNEKLKEIYNLGPTVPNLIREISMKMIVQTKVNAVKNIFDEFEFTDEKKQRQMEEIFADKEKIAVIEKQVPFWELINGLCLICGLIVSQRGKISLLTKDINTWGDLLPQNQDLNKK